MQKQPKIAITMGDPTGIGPEVCVKLLADKLVDEVCVPLVLGDLAILSKTAAQLGLDIDSVPVVKTDIDPGHLERSSIVDFQTAGIHAIPLAKESAEAGQAAWSYIEHAIAWSLDRSVDAVTTGPINKMSISKAGIDFPGHTEIFAAKTNSQRYCMMQYSDAVTCAFATTHIGYGEVLQQLNSQRVFDVIELAAAAVKRLEKRQPRIMVCGLNPHAGEQGLFGKSRRRKDHRASDQKGGGVRHRRRWTFSSRHLLYSSQPRLHRLLHLHVSRPGAHTTQGTRIRSSGQYYAWFASDSNFR